MVSHFNRRDFNKSSIAGLTAGIIPYWFTGENAQGATFRSVMERPVVGCIGIGGRWNGVVGQAYSYCDIAALCDVDANRLAKGKSQVETQQQKQGNTKPVDTYEDYRKVLDRKDLDMIICVTPDHWHSKISIESMQAGKDVYCEKPLTLTIDEGKKICQVLTQTKRVFQVGTQQRTEMGHKFIRAIAMIRDGRIGKLNKVTAVIGSAPTCSELPIVSVPVGLNWDMWLGQAPLVDYRSASLVHPKSNSLHTFTRCHGEFRWWLEYSGGKLTDWGAHHVDISLWGMDKNGPDQGPAKVEVLSAKLPVPMKDGWPTKDDQYNTAETFHVKCTYTDGVELHIRDDAPELKIDNGILFEGEKGSIFVSRNALSGAPVDELKEKPLPEDALEKVYGGKLARNHMHNLMESIISRKQPVSDVYTHHRAMTVCHLANIAIRLNRTLHWDPVKEQITGDDYANSFLTREQRKGYEVKV